MEKRRKKRFGRRLQLRYWIEGEEHERRGYTTNVSTSGAFLATNGPAPPGTRMRVEFLGENGFIIEAIVAHAARVSTSLQSIRSSGMGIRFLSIDELVAGLLPPGGGLETETLGLSSDDETTGGRAPSEDDEQGASAGPKVRETAADGTQVYTVGFRNVAYLMETMDHEIRFGGVFVPTEAPAGLQHEIRLALALPAPILRTIHADATVVKLVDPGSDPSSEIAGMAVALKEPEAILKQIQRLIQEARTAKSSGGGAKAPVGDQGEGGKDSDEVG